MIIRAFQRLVISSRLIRVSKMLAKRSSNKPAKAQNAAVLRTSQLFLSSLTAESDPTARNPADFSCTPPLPCRQDPYAHC